jgi:gliding motility-associated-like protein
MKKIILVLVLCCTSILSFAQLPDCLGADSNVVFLHGSGAIYRFDPTQPISASNPTTFINNTSLATGGLTISCNLNGGPASPTFYSTNNGQYTYWDGAAWVNTGHTSATVNLGGGPNSIFGKNGSSGYISRYFGTGNDVFFANGHANSGPYDLITDEQGYLYEIDISTAIGKIYKYDPATAAIIDTIIVLGATPQTAGPGFAMVGNKVYLGVNTTPGVYGGTIINDTVNLASLGSFGLYYGDFANCRMFTCTNVTASFAFSDCSGPHYIPVVSLLLNGSPTFLWNFDDPNSGINNTSTIGNTAHTFSGPGTYNVTLIITNGSSTDTLIYPVTVVTEYNFTSTVDICEPNTYQGHSTSGVYSDTLQSLYGCDSIVTLILNVNPIKYTVIDTTVCYGQTFLGYTSSGTYTDNFLTSKGCDSIRTINLTVREKLETFLTGDICENAEFEGYTQSGNYTDVFTSLVTGCDSTRYINLTVHPAPNVELTISDDEICKDEIVNIEASGAFTYKWYHNGNSVPITTGTNFELQVKDHEYILVEGFSDFGCRDAEIATINYVPCCGFVYIPNVFSPNNDKLNDIFRVHADRDVENFMFQIFDRWGKELYRTTNLNEGWNGMFKGSACDAGTYMYLVHIKCKESKILKGDFILIR